MEAFIISAALVAVILLLAVAVYDTNPTLQKLVAKAAAKTRKNDELSLTQSGRTQEMEQETGMNPDFDEELQSLQNPMPQSQQLPDIDKTLPGENKAEKPEIEIKKQVRLILQTLSDRITQKVRRLFPQGDSPKDLERRHEQQIILESVSSLKNCIEELSERIAETEANSDDFKDSIWSLRYSIDGIEQRLNEQNSSKTDETAARVERLEASVTGMQTSIESVKSFPDQVKSAKKDIKEIGDQLQGIHTELQNTIGYGIHKTFECASCGAEGYVASHVTCSKCGAESMWGWWPPEDEVEKASGMKEQASQIMGIEEDTNEIFPREELNISSPESPPVDE